MCILPHVICWFMKRRAVSTSVCVCGGCVVSMCSFLAVRCTQSFPAEETKCAALNCDGFSFHLSLHNCQRLILWDRNTKLFQGKKHTITLALFRRLFVAAARADVLCFQQMSAIKRAGDRCSRGHQTATSVSVFQSCVCYLLGMASHEAIIMVTNMQMWERR